jgi:hypothetical protein
MSTTAKLVVYVLLSLFVVSGAHAQLYIQDQRAQLATFCHYRADIEEVAAAFPDGADAVWKEKVAQGLCGKVPLDFLYIRTLKQIGEIRLVELRVKYEGWHTAYGLASQIPARTWEARFP